MIRQNFNADWTVEKGDGNSRMNSFLLQYIWNRIWQPAIFHSNSYLSYNKRVIG